MPSGIAEVISVAELDRRLRRVVEAVSEEIWVEGEVASLKRAPSGHAYFTLKDEREDAIVECVMYRFDAQRSRRMLLDGARIQLRGRATVWAPRGRLQFVASLARLAGRGALLEALQKLKEALAQEGLFDPRRKRALPPSPRIVGVVTSAAGAAFHDIRTVAFRRGAVRLVLAPALVQGEGAPESLVGALDLLENYPGLDVVIIGRGGGSGEDLAAFNDERVVRRVARMLVPVVSAVGHETDLSLVDLAADVRAATPSQAAELVVPDDAARREALGRLGRALLRAQIARLNDTRARFERLRASLTDPRFLIAERQQGLDELRFALGNAAQRFLVTERRTVYDLGRRLSLRHPQRVVEGARAALGPLELRLSSAMARRLSASHHQLAELAGSLHALSPLAVLGRGYAIATTRHGRAVRDSREVKAGEKIDVRLATGRISASVTEVFGPEQEP